MSIKEDGMYRTLVQMFDERVKESPLYTVQHSKNEVGRFVKKTYVQLQTEVRAMALSLYNLDVRRKDNIAIISDNRAEWLVSDLAILSLGARDVPRGRDAMDYELEYILSQSECKIAFVENLELLERVVKLQGKLEALKYIILFDNKEYIGGETDGITILYYRNLLEKGIKGLEDEKNVRLIEKEILLGSEDDVATIIFTSGTTGNPKGVMLTHSNFLYQLENFKYVVPIIKGGHWLSVLPVWHSFERVIQYVVIYYTNSIAYSKPIGKIMLMDMQYINPEYMGSVPRIWETVKAGVFQNVNSKKPIERKLFHFFLTIGKWYSKSSALVKKGKPKYKRCFYILDFLKGIIPYLLLKLPNMLGQKLVFSTIKKKFGKNFIMGFSGGGSMPQDVDEFFKAIGIMLIDGYGMTETAPVISAGGFRHRVNGVMNLLNGTEAKVVDKDGKEVAFGQKGELLVKGPQIMKGYYKNEHLTNVILDKDGYLHTGDLSIMTYKREISIVGRVKDTIVLSGGENIEPLPIEAALRESEYIQTAVVLGQDKKFLTSLIVIDAHQVERYLKNNGIPYINRDNLAEKQEVINLINQEIQKYVNYQKGFKSYEQISRFVLLETPFEVGRELSQKQEIKRDKINLYYKKEIASLYQSNNSKLA